MMILTITKKDKNISVPYSSPRGDRMMKDEVDARVKRGHTAFYLESLKGSEHLGNIHVDWRILLKSLSVNYVMEM
jgi:hypothetical protein